jgi:hypothetical protein
MTPVGGELTLDLELLNAPPVGNNDLHIRKRFSCQLDLGRSALSVALADILARGGKRVAWLPRYCCPSILEPFREHGFTLGFYSLGATLCGVDAMPAVAPGETFLFIHYFGIRNQAVAGWLETNRIKERAFIIEDCVQASLNLNVGAAGQYALYSYRKFLPVPDGAILACEHPVAACDLAGADEEFVSRKTIGKLLRGSGKDEPLFLELFAAAETGLAPSHRPRRRSWLSRFIMERIGLDEVREARRARWDVIAARFREDSRLADSVRPLFGALQPGDVPLGFPVQVEDRDELRRYLAQRSIYCPVHWPLTVDDAGTEVEQHLSQRLLTIPIDQTVALQDVSRVMECIRSFY